MLAKGRVKVCGAAVLAVLASIWAPGCATRGQSVAAAGDVSAPADAGAARAAGPVVITGASLLTEGESPRLLLTAERPLTPSVYSADDGTRVVVDLANAVVSPGMEPPRADGTLVTALGMKAFNELGVAHVQFEIRATHAVESRIAKDTAASGALSILLGRPAPAAVPAETETAETATALASSSPAAPPAEAVPAVAVVSAPAARPLAPEPIALAKHTAGSHPASRLVGVRAQPAKRGVVVELSGDGEFGYEAFRLADPPRFVLDLTGVRNASKKKQHDVGEGTVARVRVSQFRSEPEPVTRVVVDLTSDEMPSLEPTKKGLALRFGTSEPPAAPAVPAVMTAETRTAAPAMVVPAAASYEKHETEDPAERVVPPAEPVKPEPATPVAVAAQDFAEPTPAASAPKPAETVAAVHAAPSAPEVKPAESKAVETKPVAETKPVVVAEIRPATPPVAAAPVVEKKPVETKTVVAEAAPPAPKPAAAPAKEVVRTAPTVVAAVPPAPAPAPRKRASAEDKALLEAAETLLDQQQETIGRPKDVGGAYESRTVGSGEKVYTGEPITLNLKDADIRDTLLKFSELTGLNIVTDPEVRGTVTVSLTDIPWDQALELILKINGLGYVLEGNVMRISSLPKLTAEETNRLALIKAQDQNRPVRTVMQKLSYAGVAEAADLAKKVMSPRGDIFIDARNNTLIIRELPDYLPTVLDLIKNIDVPTPQVMIEARIVEATRNFFRNLGIDWGFHAVSDQAHGNTTGLIFPNNVDLQGNVALPSGTQLLKMTLGNVLNTFNLDVALTAAESRGLLKVISSPKVQTQTNQQASIQSGFQIPVQTTVNNTTSVLYVDATLRLDVTPQITAEGTIIMDIKVQKREPAVALNITGGTNTPLITRDAKTKLMVKDGGTAVIGGIFKVTANDQQNMVPGLWKIPLLGNLFRNKSVTENTDELMIFITPRIMK